MARLRQLLLLIIVGLTRECTARTWRDIEVLHSMNPRDAAGLEYLRQVDYMYENTIEPTLSPMMSAKPTASPTVSKAPTVAPTKAPTVIPTPAPTSKPDPYPPNPAPDYPPNWYFNYDTSKAAKYGPGYPGLVSNGQKIAVGYRNNQWETVGSPPGRYNVWLEFSDNGYGPWKGVLGNRDPMRNQCSRIGLQSPIDLRESGASCDEHHQVRSRPGNFRIASDNVLKQIQSNKLRLKYRRRNCADVLNDPFCMEPDPPKADFPNGWGGFADVMHIDFKVPGEHLIEGKRFDGEMQIFHLHPDRRRMPVQSALIQATDTGYNYYFEEVLKVFEYQYRYDWALCARKKRRHRQLVSESNQPLRGKNTTVADIINFDIADDHGLDEEPEDVKVEMERHLQTIGVWDPHHEMLVPSIHFWRYDGSLTEPPCGEWVSWFVCDTPMTISTSQLERTKKLIFSHVDGDCTKTSVHYDQSVARPIQDSAGRPVWKCRPSDYGPDQ